MKKFFVILIPILILTLVHLDGNYKTVAQTSHHPSNNLNSIRPGHSSNSSYYGNQNNNSNNPASSYLNNNTINNYSAPALQQGSQSLKYPIKEKFEMIKNVLSSRGALPSQPRTDFPDSESLNAMDRGDLSFIQCLSDINRNNMLGALVHLYAAAGAYREFNDPCANNQNFNKDFAYFDLVAVFVFVKMGEIDVAKSNLGLLINRSNNNPEVRRIGISFYNILEEGQATGGSLASLSNHFSGNGDNLSSRAKKDFEEKEDFLLQYIWETYTQARRERSNYCSSLN